MTIIVITMKMLRIIILSDLTQLMSIAKTIITIPNLKRVNGMRLRRFHKITADLALPTKKNRHAHRPVGADDEGLLDVGGFGGTGHKEGVVGGV